MVGGMFNGLLAPVLFKRVIEFNVAIFLACLLRPTMKEEGWTDAFLANTLEQKKPQQKSHGKGKPSAAVHVDDAPSYSTPLDFALPLVVLVALLLAVFIGGEQVTMMFGAYGVALAVACFYLARPIRFGLAIGAVLLVHAAYQWHHDQSILADRSYFGIIRVQTKAQKIEGVPHLYNQLIHGHINHGMNFHQPEKAQDRRNPKKDFSRLATTYYHRFGPAGRVMEKFNWNKDGAQNTYHADARMPLSLLGAFAADLTGTPVPLSTMVDLWSEPPFATIGLGTGTMASYARPYQHCHYYEIDNHIRRLSLPDAGQETRRRGAGPHGRRPPAHGPAVQEPSRGSRVRWRTGQLLSYDGGRRLQLRRHPGAPDHPPGPAALFREADGGRHPVRAHVQPLRQSAAGGGRRRQGPGLCLPDRQR
jgi:hypothetical protein